MNAAAFDQPQTLTERVASLLARSEYRLATKPEEREAIYRLRYDAYRRENAIEADFARSLTDGFDHSRNGHVFGIYVDGVLASSMRLHVATAAEPEMPALAPFADVLQPELDAGRVIVDPSRFATELAASRAYPDMRFVTVRLAVMASEYFGADLLLATVRTEHQAFYRRVFGHQVTAPPRQYHTLKKLLSLMTLHFPTARDAFVGRYPFFQSTAHERTGLFAPAAARSAEPAMSA